MSDPINMILHCPSCHAQHIDAPDDRSAGWANPPHRSHLCHECGTIWRPADVPTNGVARLETIGRADTWHASMADRAGGIDPTTNCSHALERLRLVAADTGPPFGHSSISQREAVEIQAEIARLRAVLRVNLLRHVPGATHAAIDAMLEGGVDG